MMDFCYNSKCQARAPLSHRSRLSPGFQQMWTLRSRPELLGWIVDFRRCFEVSRKSEPVAPGQKSTWEGFFTKDNERFSSWKKHTKPDIHFTKSKIFKNPLQALSKWLQTKLTAAQDNLKFCHSSTIKQVLFGTIQCDFFLKDKQPGSSLYFWHHPHETAESYKRWNLQSCAALTGGPAGDKLKLLSKPAGKGWGFSSPNKSI